MSRRFRCRVVLMVVGLSLLLIGSAAVGPAAAGQYCTPGGVYTVLNNYGERFDGLGAMYKDYNGTSSPETTTTTVSATATAEYAINNQINASGGFDYGIIHADMQAQTSWTLSKSYSVSGSHSVTFTIPSHQYGFVQFGGFRWYNKFNYEVVTSDCAISKSVNFPAKISENTQGYQSATNSTGAIPSNWDQKNK